ncbi:trypsin-like peptidase domain-containing protein [Stieleria sp. JC731]|uniref:trypsin-like peptidase domain-containing protein n=1 Tax=Pirellulaceae TaxID=2691357 RepID=UPI001E287A07|nr:trypsin-like peptidase domain-containing protein [Stieleria sp. JC731]MCC9599769.1 trypsin-like peptidase domain-containing protein [Stieleria sp. JC731]
MDQPSDRQTPANRESVNPDPPTTAPFVSGDSAEHSPNDSGPAIPLGSESMRDVVRNPEDNPTENDHRTKHSRSDQHSDTPNDAPTKSVAQRKLIFHRFDPGKPSTLRHHMEVEYVDDQLDDSQHSAEQNTIGPDDRQANAPLTFKPTPTSKADSHTSERESFPTRIAVPNPPVSGSPIPPPKFQVVVHSDSEAGSPEAPPRIRINTTENGELQPSELQTATRRSAVESRREVAIEINQHRQRGNAASAFQQGLVMLVTVLSVLAAAWFVVPGIVERIRYAQYRGQLRAEFEVASEGLKDVSLDSLSQAYQMVSAAVGPSVVHIDIQRAAHHKIIHDDIPGAPAILISDQGSGVVVDSEGYILTNRHVISDSDEILVTLSDGRRVEGVIVGMDELTDLALLKVDASGLIPIPWGDSERIRVGSPVWAIGSPFGLDRTVTFGILSGKHRVVRAKDRYQDFMQSDVAVNPGNSGGPLVDSHGTMVGINTAIVGDTYQGVSFAIPSTVAQKIYHQLREHGKIERGWLGVSLAEVSDEKLPSENHRLRGAQIAAIADIQSGASQAGLVPGDIVTRVEGETIRDVDHLMQVIGNAMAGTRVEMLILRDGEEKKFDVKLGRRPPQLDRR